MPILVTIELIPYGNKRKKKKIGELYIVNNGSGNSILGNYDFEIKGLELDSNGKVVRWHKGSLKGFDRGRGHLALLKEVLKTSNVDYDYKIQ